MSAEEGRNETNAQRYGGTAMKMTNPIESKFRRVVRLIESFIGQSKRQRALLMSLISVTILMLPFALHNVSAPTSPPVTKVALVCCIMNTTAITIAPGTSATIERGQINTDGSFYIPISVSGNFTSSSQTTFTVKWFFNSSLIIATPSFASSTPSQQTIGCDINGLGGSGFLANIHSGTEIWLIQVQNNSGSTLYVKNSTVDLEIAYT